MPAGQEDDKPKEVEIIDLLSDSESEEEGASPGAGAVLLDGGGNAVQQRPTASKAPARALAPSTAAAGPSFRMPVRGRKLSASGTPPASQSSGSKRRAADSDDTPLGSGPSAKKQAGSREARNLRLFYFDK